MFRNRFVYAFLIVLIFVCIYLWNKVEPVSRPEDTLNYVRKNLSSWNSGRVGFEVREIYFIPDQSSQSQVISGTVCGIMGQRSRHSAYITQSRFITAVILNKEGWGFSMNQPIIESDNETMIMDTLWVRHCLQP